MGNCNQIIIIGNNLDVFFPIDNRKLEHYLDVLFGYDYILRSVLFYFFDSGLNDLIRYWYSFNLSFGFLPFALFFGLATG
jgi:hypothetical protein